jgi:hypothetical protein
MALINCPECGKPVSTVAHACPNCGFPVAEQGAAAQPVAPTTDPETVLAEVRPSWWGYFWYLVFAWLIVPFLIAWWRRASIVLRIYPGRVRIEQGVFSKCYREFFARDIRSVDIDQGVLARMVGIGDLTLSTAATVDAAERIEGIPNPMGVRDLILAQRQNQ